ncbi:hypothetical protein [Tenacibaculum sp. IB213877]|uniref:DUF7738 domain-containing protein n=1 Tax=Tenacibaculum sp. IB213877 TaxID=3097351 RepID=UPI002A5A8279|nr:hypothetical protein [Tenacibaculum sp. IB213877]MDY0781141.1 hypothetical protein [Tenacibaculum sp. IB213877]
MFNFLKKKKTKHLVIKCDTDNITINNKEISFPTNYQNLATVLGKPSRQITKSNTYTFWDKYGIFCGYADENNILSINIYQNKLDTSEYNTKNQFKGKLFLNDEEITHNDFTKIGLGKLAILRLGSENENRFGFSLGVNRDFNN